MVVFLVELHSKPLRSFPKTPKGGASTNYNNRQKTDKIKKRLYPPPPLAIAKTYVIVRQYQRIDLLTQPQISVNFLSSQGSVVYMSKY